MNINTIYLAGGCFWGVEHFFKKIGGVLSTETGFANGHTAQPSYQEVYTDTTGYAEAVKICYNADRISLKRLLEMFFMIIDPLSVNKQGEDVGTRYRTGIYYCDEIDLQTITAVCATQESKIGEKLAVEVEALKKYYPAEDYHQDYLNKNSQGYCHLPMKIFAYAKLLGDLELMLGDEPDVTARMANTSALIAERLGFFWVGFYSVKDNLAKDGDELVLGPFQGLSACIRIKKGRGVCGASWERRESIVVPDVEEFPGHIACNSLSRSEIVVPVFDKAGNFRAVLDIDSKELNTFDRVDKEWLEEVVKLVYA